MPYTPREQWQKLLTHVPEEDLDLDPEHHGPLYVSNLVRRVIALVFAQRGDDLVRVQADADGHMQLTGEEEIPTDVDVNAGTAGAGWSDDVDFDDEVKTVTIWAFDNPLDVRFVKVAGGNTDALHIPADTAVSFDLRCMGFAVKNHAAGDADYQVSGSII